MKDIGILFDFDGTLIDSEPAILYSYEELFRRYGKIEDFTPEKRIKVVGPSIDSAIAEMFPNENTEQLVDEYRAIQSEHVQHLVQVMPHTVEVLKILKKNYKLGIVSSRRRDSVIHILNILELKDYFDDLIGYDDVKKEKPDPEGVLTIIKRMNLKDAIYIGDSVVDILAGQNANIKTVAYLSKMEKKEGLIKSQPTYLIDDLFELLDIVKTL